MVKCLYGDPEMKVSCSGRVQSSTSDRSVHTTLPANLVWGLVQLPPKLSPTTYKEFRGCLKSERHVTYATSGREALHKNMGLHTPWSILADFLRLLPSCLGKLSIPEPATVADVLWRSTTHQIHEVHQT